MLDIMALFRAFPGACAQGLVWGIMALGVYITYKLLDFADLTVDSTLATGGAVAVMLILGGIPTPVALLAAAAAGGLAGFITGFLHTVLGIPDILSGILTQIALYSVNLNILGASNKSVSVDQYSLVISLRYIPRAVIVTLIFIIALIGVLYWFFGTEYGFTIRSTGCNPHMSRAQGVNTNKAKVAALIISNAIVGLAGGLLAQYQGPGTGGERLWKADELYYPDAVRHTGRGDLLYRYYICAVARPSVRRYEAVFCDRGGSIPCCPVFKGKSEIFFS